MPEPPSALTGNADPRTDATLLADHVAGDPGAFTVLVQRHRDRLWAVALRTCHDREDAADAVQEALLSAYRKADTFRGDAAVTTWLHRIVVNACLDRMRRGKAQRTVPLPDDDADSHAQLVEQRDAIGEREVAVQIEAALAALPYDQRAAIVLVDIEGWPVESAAEILGVPSGTVKSRCHRGRARLATALAHLRNLDGSPGVAPSVGRTRPAPSSVTPGGDQS